MKVVFHFADGSTAETEAIPQLNLLAHAQIAERSLQSRCGGQCACGTCRVRVISGTVSHASKEEAALLLKAAAKDGIRLACQCFPEPDANNKADLAVEVPSERFKDARFTK